MFEPQQPDARCTNMVGDSADKARLGEFLRRAAEARLSARNAKDLEARRTFEKIAESWEKLANDLRRAVPDG